MHPDLLCCFTNWLDFLQILAYFKFCVSFLFSLFLTSPHWRCRVRVASLNHHLCQSCRTWHENVIFHRADWTHSGEVKLDTLSVCHHGNTNFFWIWFLKHLCFLRWTVCSGTDLGSGGTDVGPCDFGYCVLRHQPFWKWWWGKLVRDLTL